jgi:hypothetical protein
MYSLTNRRADHYGIVHARPDSVFDLGAALSHDRNNADYQERDIHDVLDGGGVRHRAKKCDEVICSNELWDAVELK